MKRIRNWGRNMWNYARFVALAMSTSAGILSLALAADLGRPPPAPDYDYAPRYNWDGLYFGGLVGGAHGVWTVDFFRNNNHGHAEEGFDGIEGGGWVGHNYLMSPNFVVGIETYLGAKNALKLQVINAVVDRATAKALLEAIERKAALPHLTYWIEPVETFGRMQRTSPARQPNDAALNASETREEA